MMKNRNPGRPDLTMTVTGGPAAPQVQMRTRIGVTWTMGTHSALEVPPGLLRRIDLECAFMDQLSRADRHRLLRRARRLLRPGGEMRVPVGGRADRYPRAELEYEAWVCGFALGYRTAAGCARLVKPTRKVEVEPAVSILIPAFKPRHFTETLDSALAQTWPRGEIIVADDSPGQEIADMVESARGRVREGWVLRYHRNPGNIGEWKNNFQLLDMAAGPLVKFLNDDDLLAETCVERMARVLARNPEVTLVTSRRRLIDGNGAELPGRKYTEPLLETDGTMDGRVWANLALSRRINRIGEPTTVMFRKADIIDNRPNFMSYAGRPAHRNGDISAWIALLSRGDGAWLHETLSSFRIHGDQVSHNEEFRRTAKQAWTDLQADGEQTGLMAGIIEEVEPRPLADGTPVEQLVRTAVNAWETGDHPKVRAALEQAAAEAPLDTAVRGNLARLEWMRGRKDSAVLGAALALGAEKPDPDLAADLKAMLIDLGMAPEAAAAIENNLCGQAGAARLRTP